MFLCTYCGDRLESRNLIGELDGPYARVYTPGNYPIRTAVQHSIAALETHWSDAITDKDFKPLLHLELESVFRRLFTLEFDLPYKVRTITFLELHHPKQGEAYLHTWMYNELGNQSSGECQAQLSIRCTYDDSILDMEAIIADVQMVQ